LKVGLFDKIVFETVHCMEPPETPCHR